MKITKNRLKEIILEELANEQDDKLTTSQAKAAAMAAAKETAASGMDDKERAIIANLTKKLQTAASAKALASGNLARIIAMLNKELDNTLGVKK
tara:strand:- start:98 stop:379 length:282 start_codon:yes stop_codon:yes gene_type:complete